MIKFKDYDWPCEYDGPMAHQVSTVANMIKHRRMYILNTMGTGKTLAALWACDFLARNLKIRKVLIVAPLSTVQSVWANEIFRHIRTRRAVVLHHYNKAKRLELLEKDVMFYIINHDGIKLMEKELLAKHFDVIIIDESTAFKNAQSDRSKCMMRLTKITRTNKVKAVYGLTGSMTANNCLDAYGQMKVINPYNKNVPRYYTRFRDLLTTQYDEYTYVPKDNWKQILMPMIQPSIRYTIDECIDLPEMVIETRDVKMTTRQKQIYNTMRKEFIVELKEGKIKAANAGVKVMKLAQISCGAVFNTDGEIIEIENTYKLKEMLTIFNQLERRKLIIFSTFRASLVQIKAELNKQGISAELIYGGVNMRKRSKIFDDFQSGDLEVLVMQPYASAHGLTLTASSTILWFSPVTSNEIHQQANHRIRRPGQKHKQIIIRLQASPIEKKMYKALDGKQTMSRQLLEMLSE